MNDIDLRRAVELAWEDRNHLDMLTSKHRTTIHLALSGLDSGRLRIAELGANGWIVHDWLKQAVLLSFRIADNVPLAGAGGAPVFDKIAMKFADWDAARFTAAGIRVVPGAVVRHSAFIEEGVVLMPCFINVGARIGAGTMVDTWSTIGSCAQIGAHCHISGGVGIAGVLEPLQATPVIIEDHCFIGARSEVAEGVVVERGAVLAMGVFIGASTKIIDRETGAVSYGRVPAYSVVVPGSLPGKPLADGSPGPALACAVIVKRVDERTRAKTAINDLLRA